MIVIFLARLDGDVHGVVGVSVRDRRQSRAHAVDCGFFVDHCVASGAPSVLCMRVLGLLGRVSARNQSFDGHWSLDFL